MDERVCPRRGGRSIVASGTIILTDPIACAVEKADAEEQAGNLLADLERRQDDVLAQLDDLDRRVSDLLRGLGVTLIEDSEAVQFVNETGGDSDSIVTVEATTPTSSVAALAADSDEQAATGNEVVETTAAFSKLPKGETKSRSGKRSETAFNDSETWDQNARAA